MTEKEKAIRDSIRRVVPHLARENGVKQDEIWKQMNIVALDKLFDEVKKRQPL